MTNSHHYWASTDTLQQLFPKMEAMVNAHTPGQDFAVLMDVALVHISAETKHMLQGEFGHIRIIMIPPQTTGFLQPCDVGFMRPLKSTILRRTACEKCAKAIYNNTGKRKGMVDVPLRQVVDLFCSGAAVFKPTPLPQVVFTREILGWYHEWISFLPLVNASHSVTIRSGACGVF